MPRGVRVAAWMVLLITLSALSAQHIGAAPTWAPQGSGGIAGQALANGLTTVLGAFGGSLLLLTLAIVRSEEHTSELQSLMRISYAVFCLKKKNTRTQTI